FFQAEDGIRDRNVSGVQTCALPISTAEPGSPSIFSTLTRSPSATLYCLPPVLTIAYMVGLPLINLFDSGSSRRRSHVRREHPDWTICKIKCVHFGIASRARLGAMNSDCSILPSRGQKTKIFFRPIAGSAGRNRQVVKGGANVAHRGRAPFPTPHG